LVISIATFCAGTWALYTYVLSEPAKYEAFQRRAATYSIPAVSISIACAIPHGEYWLVLVDVGINNTSRSELTVGSTRPSVISASPVVVSGAGILQLGERTIYGSEGFAPTVESNSQDPDELVPTEVLPTAVVGAGQKSKARYLLTLSDPGVYQVTFLADRLSGDSEVEGIVLFDSANVYLERSPDGSRTSFSNSPQTCAGNLVKSTVN
jgi:hypothetical protein